MIVRDGHQTAELIRKGRRVDYVYKGGKRVFGYEGAEKIDIISPKFVEKFPSFYYQITKIEFSQVVPENYVQLIDISYSNTIYKTYVFLVQKETAYTAIFVCKYWGRNSIFVCHNSWNSAFRGLAVKELPLSNFDTSLVTDMNYFAADCTELETTKGIENLRFDSVSECSYVLGHNWTSNTYDSYKLRHFEIHWKIPENIRSFSLLGYVNLPTLNYFYMPDLNLVNSTTFTLWLGNFVCSGYFKMGRIITSNKLTIFRWQRTYFSANFDTLLLDLSGFYIPVVDSSYRYYVIGWSGIWDVVKTPDYCIIDLKLPTTYYNADGTIYGNVIPANSVGSVTIYRTPPTT